MLDQVDVHQLRQVRDYLRFEIASYCETLFANRFRDNQSTGTYQIDPDSMARRGLPDSLLAAKSAM